MVMDETNFVTQIKPIELTGVRDEAVQSLILLAVSLGWNVMMKRGQPAVLNSRDGTQKRLPTDTSIRMSVFQTALSTIMVHSGDQEPTPDLIDDVIKHTKPSRDHQRRLRLAVGETPADHRARLATADKPGQHERVDEEHLTQRVRVPDEVTQAAMADLASETGPPGGPKPVLVAADGGEHGALVSRAPFQAHYSGSSQTKGAQTYQSQVSLERKWSDGYIDYECTVCGKAYSTPRGVGSHRQNHIKAGEVEAVGTAPYRRPDAILGRDPAWSATSRKQTETVEFVDALPPTDVVNPMSLPPMKVTDQEAAEFAEAVDVQREYMGTATALDHDPELASLDILDKIIELVLPEVKRTANEVIVAITAERDEALRRLAEVEGEFDALVDLLNSRRQK